MSSKIENQAYISNWLQMIHRWLIIKKISKKKEEPTIVGLPTLGNS